VPTISALATRLGLLHEEFSSESDLDVAFHQSHFSGIPDWDRGNGFWLHDASLVPAIWGRARGVDSRLVALALLDGSHPVVALTSSGIRSVADLKGKRLGIVKDNDSPLDLGYAQQLKIYTTTLSTGGLTFNDVKLVPIEGDKVDPAAIHTRDAKTQAALQAGKDLAQRLQRNEFDAIAVHSASDVAHHVSIRVLYDVFNHQDYLARAHANSLRGVVVSGRLLRERRGLVVRVLARLLQAADWAKARPKETVSELAEHYDEHPDSLTDKYENLSAGLQINLGIEKILSLKAQKNFLLRHRLIEKDFDIDPWVDHGPLVEAHVLYDEWKRTGRVS
jgi:sulfonate transport system substrate-binding protein